MGLKTQERRTSEGYESTIFVQSKDTQVKVEINLVVRGAIHKSVLRTLAPSAQEQFKRSAEMQCLNTLNRMVLHAIGAPAAGQNNESESL